jgi:hypothetical protein
MRADEAEVEIGRLLGCHAAAHSGVLRLDDGAGWLCQPLDRDDINRLVMALSVIAAELHRREVSDDR